MRILPILIAVLALAEVGQAGPRPSEMKRIEPLARSLKDETAHLHELAESEAGRAARLGRAEREDVEALAAWSSWYAAQVVAQRSQPERTESSFARLTAALAGVRASVGRGESHNAVERSLREVERLCDELAPYYDQPGAVGTPVSSRPDPPAGSLPAGTAIVVRLDRELRARDLRIGDTVPATVTADVQVEGRRSIPAGAAATLKVVELDEAGRVKGRERLSLELSEIELDRGRMTVDSSTVTWEAEESTGRDAATIAGGTAVGAIIGAVTDGGGGAAKGAVIGAIGGTGVVLLTKGKEVRLAAGERVEFRLDVAARVPGAY